MTDDTIEAANAQSDAEPVAWSNPAPDAAPSAYSNVKTVTIDCTAPPRPDTSAGPDSKLEELVSRWEALKDGGGPSAPCGVLQDELLTIISLARKGLTAPPDRSGK